MGKDGPSFLGISLQFQLSPTDVKQAPKIQPLQAPEQEDQGLPSWQQPLPPGSHGQYQPPSARGQRKGLPPEGADRAASRTLPGSHISGPPPSVCKQDLGWGSWGWGEGSWTRPLTLPTQPLSTLPWDLLPMVPLTHCPQESRESHRQSPKPWAHEQQAGLGTGPSWGLGTGQGRGEQLRPRERHRWVRERLRDQRRVTTAVNETRWGTGGC